MLLKDRPYDKAPPFAVKGEQNQSSPVTCRASLMACLHLSDRESHMISKSEK